MPYDAEFACPRCGEKVRVSDKVLLHDRKVSFKCAHCGAQCTVDNAVPDAMEKHLQSLMDELVKPKG